MRIVVVDDSKAMRMIVTRALRQAGYTGHQITEAANGREALEAIHCEGADLVLSDWNMPEMSGIQLLHTLRRDGRRVPFCFVTSEGSPLMRAQAEEAGAMGLITKPFTAETFQEALDPILG